MVSEVKKDSRNWLDKIRDDFERRKLTEPVVRERWWVVEYSPPRKVRQGDGHGGTDWATVNGEEIPITDYLYDYAEVEAYLAEHVADEGKELQVKHQNLRRITEERWVNY